MGIIDTGIQLYQKASVGINKAMVDIQAGTFATSNGGGNNGGNSVLDKIFAPIVQFLSDLTGYVYVAVIIAVLAVGIMFLGGQKSREKAREYLPYIFVGSILAVGAVTIGQSITNTFTFN